MTQQLELELAERRARVAELDAGTLLFLLRQAGTGRMTAGEIGARLDWDERRVRAAAEAAGGDVLSAPGLAGYRLAAATPVQDYLQTERRRYRSQIRAMVRRMIAMDRAVHGGVRRMA